MAKFKVGDRVRIVTMEGDVGHKFNGSETTITGPRMDRGFLEATYRTKLTDNSGFSGVCESRLVPILPDTASDEFIARLKRLGHEPVTTTKKETA